MAHPHMISGNFHKDQDGGFAYNPDTSTDKTECPARMEEPEDRRVHAWQGHKKIQKWFQAEKGSFLVLVVKPDNWENPSFGLTPMEFVLQEGKNQVLHVPGGFVTGFKAIEPGSKLLIASDSMEESPNDNYHFDEERWYYETFM